MEFKVGDKAVYPAHGVGVIAGLEEKRLGDIVEGIDDPELAEERVRVYVLKILDNGMDMDVPVNQAIAQGMRPVISTEHVEKVYDILRDRDVPMDTQTWNRRYREYVNKISTGDPIEVAKVLRDLALLKKDKNLSFGERKTYDQAMNLLIQEIAVSKDAEESVIKAEIEKIFAK